MTSKRQHAVTRFNCFTVSALAFTVISAIGIQANAQVISPGAVQPQIEVRPIPQAESDVLGVPPVIDRPLGLDEGPKVIVSEFIFNFKLEADKKTKLKKEVDALLEDIRVSQPEGFTIGQLQQAANQATQLIRNAGYILAQAYIPQQQITDGKVFVDVLIGSIGKISVEGNEKFRTDTITKALDTRNGQEIKQQEIEGALLRVDDLAGLDAYGIFRPGDSLGEADLVVKINNEKSADFYILADDYGSEATGNLRLLGSASFNNFAGYGDRLSITALQSYMEDPDDSGLDQGESQYFAFQYEIPVTANATIGLSYNINDYDIFDIAATNLVNTDLAGETKQASLFFDYSIIRSRTLNFYNNIEFTLKSAELDSSVKEIFNGTEFVPINTVTGQPLIGEDKLTVLTYEIGASQVDSFLGGGINEGALEVSFGLGDVFGSMGKVGDSSSLRINKDRETAGGDFKKYKANLSRLQAVRSINAGLLMRVEGQYSPDFLSSLEQMSIGGPNSVRAYPVSEYVADRGYFSSLELIFNAPGFSNVPAFGDKTWGEVLELSVYADYAKGELNEAIDSEIEISGYGFGAQLQIQNTLFIRADIARPLGDDEDPSNGDTPQVWFTAGYQF